MTDDDELRTRIARRDPARRPEAAGLLRAATADRIRERAMETTEAAPTTTPAAPRPRRRGPALVLASAASVAAIAVAAVLVTRDGAPAPGGTTLTLRTAGSAAGGPTMGSCVPFDTAILRDMPVAFAGTAVEVEPGTVTLDVDRWYKGGTAERVVVTTSSGMPVSIDGVDFAEGGRYLVAATSEGEVNGCGFSGPATAELERAYGEAFGG